MKILTFPALIALFTIALSGCGSNSSSNGVASGTSSSSAPVIRPLRVKVLADASSSALDIRPTYSKIAARVANALLEKRKESTWDVSPFINSDGVAIRDVTVKTELTELQKITDYLDKLSAPQENGTYYAPPLDSVAAEAQQNPGTDYVVLILSDGGIDDKGKVLASVEALAKLSNIKQVFLGPIPDPKIRKEIMDKWFAAFATSSRLQTAGVEDWNSSALPAFEEKL